MAPSPQECPPSAQGAAMAAEALAGAEAEATAGAEAVAGAGEQIVISGMSGLYPNAHNVTDFQTILYNKIDPVSQEADRWVYNHPEVRNQIGKVPGLQKFDAQFFKVHYRAANNMDAMSRKVLEQAYQAIYDSGMSPEQLKGKKVGVYVGSCFSETDKSVFYVADGNSGFGITGCSKSMFSNRISYWLNAKGPSMTVDESCTSSSLALKLAYHDLMRGECEAAIVAGSSISLHPQSTIHYGRLMKLSKDGKTKSFDENAEGFGKSEAINALFLQKAKDALRVYAELIHVNTEFTSLLNGELGPRYGPCRNPSDNAKFLREFYDVAKVPPQAVEYVEAFGSADPDADKSELDALDNVFCKDRKGTLLVGSVMSNVGYGEAASGITAITKVLLGYHTGLLAGNLYCAQPRRDVSALCEGRMRVLADNTRFNRGYTAVNQLSCMGVNSHVLLRGQHKQKDPSRYKSPIPHIAFISGRHEPAVAKVLKYLKRHPIDPEQIALLNNIHLTHISGHLARGYTILDKDTSGQTVCLRDKVDHFDYTKRPLWFVYSGMGSQWPGMGRQLMRIPIFAKAIQGCHKVLQPLGVDIVNIITTEDKTIFDNILHSFVGIAAVQIGLTDVLRELGLEPDMIIGHSVGELGCAYADGCISAEEMILCAFGRGLVSVQTPFIRGSMAAVGIGYKQIVPMCPPEIEVACHNGPHSCTISGPAEIMQNFVNQLVSQKIFAKEVPCSNIAYHSRYIKDAGPGLLKFLSKVITNPKPRSARWLSTSVPMEHWGDERAKYSSADYHTNNLLSPVLFEETSRLIPADAVLVEVAPHALLQAILTRSLPASCTNVPLTQRGHPDNALFLLEAMGKLYVEGFNPKIQSLYPKIEFPVSTGTPLLSHLVEWSHEENWYLPLYAAAKRKTAAAVRYVISIHDKEHAYLSGHVIKGKIVYPYSATLVCVWDALSMSLGKPRRSNAVRLRDVTLHARPLLHARRQLRLSVALHRGSGRFEVLDDLNSRVASGFINEIDEDDETKTNYESDDSELEITSTEIYNQFLTRDVCYKDSFQSIHSANLSLTKARIHWKNDWVTFIDGLIQLNALKNPQGTFSRLDSINNLIIKPKEHYECNNSLMTATSLETHNATRCGGVILEGLKFNNVPISTLNTMTLEARKIGSQFKSNQRELWNQKLSGGESYEVLQTNARAVGMQSSLVGPLHALHWVETPLLQPSRVTVKVHYAGLNDIDVKRSIGLIPPHRGASDIVHGGYGMDFSGFTESGDRVMGLVECGAASSHVQVRGELLWPIPRHWSLQDAATVPLAYCLAYYCLTVTTPTLHLKPGLRILVHGGASSVGQAFISIALYYGCEVFAAVSSSRKKELLLKLFPNLKAENIGSSENMIICDTILNATNGEGVDLMIICDLKKELKNQYVRCVKCLGVCIDLVQIPNKEHFDLQMNILTDERSYKLIDFFGIFKYEDIATMKRLQCLLSEGIACGAVRPLTRVTFPADSARRALRLLATGAPGGRALLRLRDTHDRPPPQPRLKCSADRCHVVISDHFDFGQQLADRLVNRGARQLHLYLPLSPQHFKLKMRQLQERGVQVQYQVFTDAENVIKLLNENQKIQHVEGIYLFISTTEGKAANLLVKRIDELSRKLYPDLKYFAVINTTNTVDERTCVLRAEKALPGTMIKLPELREAEGLTGAEGASVGAAVSAAEAALAGARAGSLRATVPPAPRDTLLQRLTALTEIHIPEDADETATLLDLGITTAECNNVFVFLRDAYNIVYTIEEIKHLTIQRIQQIGETLTKTDFDKVRGLKALFTQVDSDELLATTDIVFLPTLAANASMRDDEFNSIARYLCVVPGVEGHYARFRTLCERVKLPALVLQPPIDRPHDSPRQLAERYVEVLTTKANVKNNFYLLGYEAGVLVALEMAAILEANGFTGTVFCIGTPEEVKLEMLEHLAECGTEESLQDALLRHMYGLMAAGGARELQQALRGVTAWRHKLDVTVATLLGHAPHTAQYARQQIAAAHGRITQVLRAGAASPALRSRLILMRPASSLSEPLRPASSLSEPLRYTADYALAAPLASATEDLLCSTVVNNHLDADILEAFDKTNLCDSYLTNSDLFIETK